MSITFSAFHLPHNLHRLHTNRAYPHQQVYHLFFVIGKAVGIKQLGDGGVFGFLFFELVKDPFQCAAVAKFVNPGKGGNATRLESHSNAVHKVAASVAPNLPYLKSEIAKHVILSSLVIGVKHLDVSDSYVITVNLLGYMHENSMIFESDVRIVDPRASAVARMILSRFSKSMRDLPTSM